MPSWREDMQRIVQSAGGGQDSVVFLFSDTQIKDERFVEDISNLLNSGEIPNLYPPEDKLELLDYVREQHGKRNRELADMNPAALYNWFVARTRTQLHIVLAFSPIGDAFRERLRKFPSLINCCTIDWFTAWPNDALNAVAEKFLGDIDLGDSFADICAMCQTFHSSVDKLGVDFRTNLGRINYLTPTSYLALIQAYKNSLGHQREHVMGLVHRYENGLVALNDAASAVGEMQEELIALQPTLKESQKATKKLLGELAEKLPGVNAQKEKVAADAAEVQIEVDRVGGIKAQCDLKLGEAMPILNDAIASLDVLTVKDIQMAGSFSKPPAIIDFIVGAVCVMMGIKAKKVADPDDPSKKIEDWWTPGKQMLKSGGKLLDQLKGYDKDNIDPKILKKIRSTYISDERFTVEKAAGASATMVGLVKWTRAMSQYDEVVQIVAPLRSALAVAEKELAAANAVLDKKKAALKIVVDDLNMLEAKLAGAKAKKQQLEDQVADCEAKLIRARQLIESLGGEKDRWTEEAKKQRAAYVNLTGDVLISAGVIAYLGPFTSVFRDRAINEWVGLCQAKGIPSSETVSLNATLGDPVSAMTWKSQGLPSDDFSIDNAIVVFNSERWPLLIDPEGQGNRWIRNMEESRGLQVIKLTNKNYLRTLEFALPNGQPVLLENVGEVLDPTLEPLLLKQTFAAAGVMNIRLGDKDVEYADAFRFYITTKLRNPHYLPEVAVKVTLLNFMITPAGLQAQVLVKTVELERPELAKTARSLVVEGAANATMLKELEDKILQTLAAEGNILEDVAAVDTLKEAKETAKVIEAKDRIAKKTTADIAVVREGYIPVAFRVQLLFFCISSLFFIEPVYAYSLDWYMRLYETATKQAENPKDLDARLESLKEYFTYSLYKNICRSLLEKDKLLFSFMLTVNIMKGNGEMDNQEWLFLLTGGISSGGGPENPCPDWLPDKSWGELLRLQALPAFAGIADGFTREAAEWKAMYDKVEAHTAPLPRQWNTKLSSFQKLMCLRCIRPDKIVLSVQNFIIEKLGEKFCKPPAFDLKACYEDSSVISPLIFILSPGSDPQAGLDKLCDQMGVTIEYKISLGQGQGEKAAKYIERARKEGKWVELMNCHLAVSWMSDLEAIVENINEDNTHPAFRLWLTTYPSMDFPVSILQNGVKMTNEPPKGLRANLIGSYLTDPIPNPDFWNDIDGGRGVRAEAFRKLIFGLTFFHAIIQERRHFGPLGWNIPYEFNESDLRICVQQLSMFMKNAPVTVDEDGTETCIVPYNALRYTCGECNYGGRVTDDKDRRALHCILRRFYAPVVVEVPNNVMSDSGTYIVPTDGAHKSYLQQLDAWPLVSAPEVFSMHENANITKDQKETSRLFASAIDTQGSSSGGGGGADRDDMVSAIAKDFASKLPGLYDMELAEVKYPTLWENSMNTVIVQELERFNILIDKVRSDFQDVQLAIQGLVVMSGPLEKVANALYVGRVPMDANGNYFDISYPSLKPLAGYMTDLFARLEFFEDWLTNGPPPNFWLSGFYFNQAFLTGTLQVRRALLSLARNLPASFCRAPTRAHARTLRIRTL
jgi:dynein heavy chain